MPSAITRTHKNRRSSRRNNSVNRPQPTTAIRIVSAAKSGNTTITITFDQTMSLSGTPGYTTDVVGATATSAVRDSPTVISVTFSTSIAAATKLSIPYEDKAVRNLGGGFVADSTFAVT